MSTRITIDPVTRIEGHARISLFLNDEGRVDDAQFHVTQVRGFEKIGQGRPFHEMPSLMARICGICPVSHLMAGAKACDALLAVRIPETGARLRRVMNLAQNIQSHALSFFHLSSPDLLLGMDSDPTTRNVFGVIQEHPERAQDGIQLRKFGQSVIEILGGKRIHPAWVVPGGVNAPLSEEKRSAILAMLPDAKDRALRTMAWFKSVVGNYQEETATFANFPTLFMGLVGEDGSLEHYDGKLRVVNASGAIIADNIEPQDYQDVVGEAVLPWSYLKAPYYKPYGYPDGIYRVGPLARLNICSRCGTPHADAEWAEFRRMQTGPTLSSFHYHYARLIEIVYGLESIENILSDPDILNPRVRAFAEPNSLEGVGISEAPRGTLIHHYKINQDGLIEWANLIIATGHNNLAINRGVLQVARHFVDGNQLQEGMLNRVEAVVRAFDPCLSCSTHAAGEMPLHVSLISPDGAVVDEIRR